MTLHIERRNGVAVLTLDDPERRNALNAELCDELREIRIRVGEGIAGHVMATGEILRIDDAALDARFATRLDRQSGFVTRSVLCMPLVHLDGRRIGVVQALNRHGGPFSEHDEEVLSALCAQVAIAIENERPRSLLEHIQRR